MIKINEIEKAMAMIEDPILYLNCTAIEKQLVASLEVYLDRGEYIKGNLDSAIKCLTLAGYEIEKQFTDLLDGFLQAAYQKAHEEPDGARDLANADLLASAPDLLEALERLTDLVETSLASSKSHDLLVQNAKTAIAKARGES